MAVRFRRVYSDDLTMMKSVYRLRYEVYCLDCRFENPENFPDGIEQDNYDKFSLHFVAENDHDEVIGTVRLIKHSDIGFPLEKHYHLEIRNRIGDRNCLAEISRLAVVKKWRSPEVTLGLWREVYQVSKRLGILYWYAAMELKLGRLLQKYHLFFEPIGALAEYNGLRVPCLGRVDKLERTLAANDPAIYHYFREGLDTSMARACTHYLPTCVSH